MWEYGVGRGVKWGEVGNMTGGYLKECEAHGDRREA